LIGALPLPDAPAAELELELPPAGALDELAELDEPDELPHAARPRTNRIPPNAANHEVLPLREFMLLSSPWGLVRPNFHR
jgi:hypothetical protein